MLPWIGCPAKQIAMPTRDSVAAGTRTSRSSAWIAWPGRCPLTTPVVQRRTRDRQMILVGARGAHDVIGPLDYAAVAR
jgi:hypothetical protein